MSNLLNKMWSKLLALIVIVLFVVAFRDMILTDTEVSIAFGALMGTLPFAKQITDIICDIMKYQYTIPNITSTSIIADFLRLAVMASIQPIVIWILSLIFLKVPSGPYYEREEYMDGLNYRLKEMIITIITSPLIALVAAYLTSYISNYLTTNFGFWLSSIFGIVSVVVMSAISIIPLLIIGGITIGTAILWRVVVTLLGKMVITMGTNAICLWIYLSIVDGLYSQTFSAIIFLIAWLIIVDFGLQCLKRAIVSSHTK